MCFVVIAHHADDHEEGQEMIKKLTTRHLQKLYKGLLESGRIHVGKNQDRGLSATSVHSVHRMLHCALEQAVKERLIPRPPVRTASSQNLGNWR